ncbi:MULTISPECIES: TetR/AcrR family transcriptional regulator [unclassified Prevotella]|uniref:TetR/AcrR family transcriptional regulator n=1 Tax=unclassified Prevotella TaxID=2638335 RepID=UPI0018CC742B|nr:MULTISPECIES: TetR/AcrR family transcriptional regulator [unclassified Prevotella]
MKLFTERGINSVRMDDVAQTMGISKRTIYELYNKKEDLLFEVVVKHFRQRLDVMELVTSRCNNVMEILLEVYRMKVADFKNTNPLFFTEMVKYPELQQFLTEQNDHMRENSLLFIQRGVDEGYFRSDLDYQMAVLQFDAMGQYVMEKELYKQYSIEDIFRNLVFVSLRGLCTDKGIKAIDAMLEQK